MASTGMQMLASTLCLLGSVGLILAFIGGKCTRFLDKEGGGVKGKVAVAAGAVLITTGLLCLIPTSWAAGSVVRTFYSASVDAQRREIGACLYIGWGASILLVLGGGLFISSACPLKAHDTDKSPSVRYLVVRSSNGSNQARSQHSTVPPARSQPVGAVFPRSQSYEGASTKSQVYTRPPLEDGPEQGSRLESERSWAPSTKSQMKRPESVKSEHSEAPSTKSQLKQAEMEDNLSVKSENEDTSSNPAKTYL
uniref:Claudin 30d n=1 Tax=Lateolabrax maculatus TaxID=315492 RepID=A0A8X8RHP2_LATMC|nr:claudin 30d [Lateolabrax maculatus]